MRFAKVENNAVVTYPYTLRLFKQDNPGVSPPNDISAASLAEYGVVQVAEVAQPAPSDPMAVRVVEATPTNIGGTWTQTWVEEALSAEEIADLQKEADQQAVEDAAKADAFVQQFVGYNADQVQNYIENNVTDFASAKAVIKKLALISLALAKSRLS